MHAVDVFAQFVPIDFVHMCFQELNGVRVDGYACPIYLVQIFFKDRKCVWIGREPVPIDFVGVFFQEVNGVRVEGQAEPVDDVWVFFQEGDCVGVFG